MLVLPEPDISAIIIEDGAPVDNIFSEKQQRLLTEVLYTAVHAGELPALFTAANVGVFYALRQPPLVPDVLLAMDIELTLDFRRKANRSYFVWEFGKVPDLVMEIVSNQEGNELGSKLRDYARIGIAYYLVFDPLHLLSASTLQIFELHVGAYQTRTDPWLERVGLGVSLWEGEFEQHPGVWLRWCNRDGELLLTGMERAEREQQRAEREQQRASSAEAQALRLAQQLRALGIEPETL